MLYCMKPLSIAIRFNGDRQDLNQPLIFPYTDDSCETGVVSNKGGTLLGKCYVSDDSESTTPLDRMLYPQ